MDRMTQTIRKNLLRLRKCMEEEATETLSDTMFLHYLYVLLNVPAACKQFIPLFPYSHCLDMDLEVMIVRNSANSLLPLQTKLSSPLFSTIQILINSKLFFNNFSPILLLLLLLSKQTTNRQEKNPNGRRISSL